MPAVPDFHLIGAAVFFYAVFVVIPIVALASYLLEGSSKKRNELRNGDFVSKAGASGTV